MSVLHGKVLLLLFGGLSATDIASGGLRTKETLLLSGEQTYHSNGLVVTGGTV